ncbi:hypothetical protein C0995_009883 [Termitomyces sp. Mi166|nr:hypothetical protein C0995_009883 [Termitomyces sp. Mi166\
MAQTLNFSVNDTSPTISYSPFADIFPTNLTAGWNSFFNNSGPRSLKDIGNGTSSHATSLDRASLNITWNGTGIQVLGYVEGNAGYNITLDGFPKDLKPKDKILAAVYGLPDRPHTLSISAVIPTGDIPGTFIFDSAIIYFNAPSSSPLIPQSSSNIHFRGGWSIQNARNFSNLQFYQSQTKGDVISSTFSDTVLFYATGLDPTSSHNVQIKNEDGGVLSLNVDGFQTFSTGLLSSSQPTPTPLSKGTIAAFVLAGILGFLIIIGFLYFYLVIRPQRRRKRLARIARLRKKEKEGGPLGVLNIAPAVFPEDLAFGSQEGTLGHHKKQSSEKSGHGHGKGKKKAKPKQVSESSRSTRYALELPVRHDSVDSFNEKDVGPSRFSTDTGPPLTDIHTLSYMNTPSVRPAAAPTPALSSHSKSGSNSDSHSSPRSKPRPSFHGHLPFPSQSSTVGLLLSYDKTKPGSHEEGIGQSYGPFVASISPPSDPGHLSALAPRDRGSAGYSSDDTTSYYLGSAATRLAIRNLSPRTTQSPQMQSFAERIERKPRTTDKTPEPDEPGPSQPARGTPSPPNYNPSFLYVATPASKPVDIPSIVTPAVEIPPAAVPELPENVLLDVSPSSPLRIDFPGNSPRADSHLEPSVTHTPGEGSSEQKQSALIPRSVFRLTPPSNPPSTGHGRNSFLDLEASSDTSCQFQSATSSGNSTPKQEVEWSRWNTSTLQTTHLSRSGTSNVSVSATSPASSPTSFFPYPVSLPLSSYHPEGHLPSRFARPHSGGQADRTLAQVLRLSAFGSPTDSVPMSVTERRLRHSGSTGSTGGRANSSRLLPHPPLPSGHSSTSSLPL